jgi:hypothetical protein
MLLNSASPGSRNSPGARSTLPGPVDDPHQRSLRLLADENAGTAEHSFYRPLYMRAHVHQISIQSTVDKYA